MSSGYVTKSQFFLSLHLESALKAGNFPYNLLGIGGGEDGGLFVVHPYTKRVVFGDIPLSRGGGIYSQTSHFVYTLTFAFTHLAKALKARASPGFCLFPGSSFAFSSWPLSIPHFTASIKCISKD